MTYSSGTRSFIASVLLGMAAVTLLLAACGPVRAQQRVEPFGLQYQFPGNGATGITRQTTIILRPGDQLNSKTIKASLLTVRGAFSGLHDGTLTLSDDQRTMIFKPTTLFTYSERVIVTLRKGILTTTGRAIDSLYFTFTIQVQPKNKTESGAPLSIAPHRSVNESELSCSPLIVRQPDLLALPPMMPTLINGPAPGALFLTPFNSSTLPSGSLNSMAIVNDSGQPIYGVSTYAVFHDLKLHANGLLTYFDAWDRMWYAMDSNYVIVDSFWCGNGYFADMHDIQLLPNGHALLLACDTVRGVDIRQWIGNAPQQSNVIGVVVQEIDRNKNVIFNWRSLDSGGYKVSDMIEDPYGYLEADIDEIHANSLQLDADGNIILSARHLDEVTKLDRNTGKMLWRLGGRNNQFTLVGDSIWFSHQHDVRRLDNGHITLFDNGNDHSYGPTPAPFYSRACEYALDEKSKTVTLVWQFDDGRRDSSVFMGSVQRLPNGNTLIGWGGNNMQSTSGPAVTEVRPDGTKTYELSFGDGFVSYRAYRFPWKDLASHAGVQPHYASAVPAADPTLSEPYPNPAATTAPRMTVALSTGMMADLRLYDAMGREVATAVSGVLCAGPHELTLPIEGLANGLYHAVLRAGGRTLTRAVVLER